MKKRPPPSLTRIVVEFIDGRTVRQWGTAHGPYPLALAADLASQRL